MSHNNLLKEILKNTSLTLVISNLSSIFVFISQNILIYNWASKNTVEDFTIFFGYIEVFILFILITPVLIPKIIKEIDIKKINHLLKAISYFLFFNILILFFIFFILIEIGFHFVISDITDYFFLIILLLNVLVVSFFNTIESLYYGLRRIKKIGLLKISYSVIFFSLVIILQIFRILNIHYILLVYLISYLGSLILVLRHNLKNFLKRKPIFDFNKKLAKQIISFSYPLLLMNIFYFINYKAGILILNNVKGIYSIYYFLSTSLILVFIGLIGRPLNNISYSYIVEFFKEEKSKNLKETYNFILSVISIITIGGLVLIYNISPVLLNFLYNKYYNKTFLIFLRFIIVGGIFYSLDQFLGKIIIAKGNTKINLLAELVGGIANIFFFILCLIFKDIVFAGIGFITSTLFTFIIYVYFNKKYLDLTLKKLKVIQVILAGLFSIFIFELISYFFSFYFISIISSLVFYFLFLLIFDITSFQQIKSIANMVLKIFKRIIQC